MRALVVFGMVVVAVTAHADGPPGWRGDPRSDLFVAVPLEYDPRVVVPFGGSHHAVPSVVTINKAPYYCAPHKQSFRERVAFVEHLSVKHGLTDEEIPGMVMVHHNQVRYVGD